MSTKWIDQPDALRAFCRDAEGEVLAVDTESDHFHAYNAQVCLIQMATPQAAALVDPLAMTAEELAPLFELLEDPEIDTILHAARNDIIELDRDYGVGIANLFDTQIACRFLGYEGRSLDYLLKEVLDVSSSGNFQRFDWTRRPIPDDAAAYAAGDVLHLPALREQLLAELDATRWLEPFRQHCAYVAKTRHEPNEFDPSDWRGVKGAGDLDGPGRAVLRDLFQFRHDLCTRLNRAAVLVFRDRLMTRIAREKPKGIDELADMKGMPGALLRHDGEAILEVVTDALEGGDHPPVRAPRQRTKPEPSQEERARYNALRRWRNDMAKEVGLDTEFVATNATLRLIAADPPSNLAELEAFDDMQPWQVDWFGTEMLHVLQKQG